MLFAVIVKFLQLCFDHMLVPLAYGIDYELPGIQPHAFVYPWNTKAGQ